MSLVVSCYTTTFNWFSYWLQFSYVYISISRDHIMFRWPHWPLNTLYPKTAVVTNQRHDRPSHLFPNIVVSIIPSDSWLHWSCSTPYLMHEINTFFFHWLPLFNKYTHPNIWNMFLSSSMRACLVIYNETSYHFSQWIMELLKSRSAHLIDFEIQLCN